jgi:hypothetical protein
MVQRRPKLPRRRPQRLAFAPAALAAAFVHLLPIADARAQSAATSTLQPSLTDPRHAQHFGRTPVSVTRAIAPAISRRRRAQANLGPPARPAKTTSASRGRASGTATTSGAAWAAHSGRAHQCIGNRRAGAYAEAYRSPDAPMRRPPVPPQDPFEPLGLRIGSFLLRPSFEIARGFDSNPARVTSDHGSYYTRVEPALQLRSQWARHAYGADLRGNFTSYDTLSSSNRPQVDARTFR